MLTRLFFARRLFFIVFLFFFVINVRATEQNDSQEEKQAFLRENILERHYDADEFTEFLQIKKGEPGLDIKNWQMEELREVVNEFIAKKQEGKAPENLLEGKEQIPANEEKNEKDSTFGDVNNNILQINKENNNEIKYENNDLGNNFIGQNIALSVGNPNLLMKNNQFVQGSNDSINITHDQSSLTNSFYDLSHNKIASRFFCFYRYGGKFLTSLVWSVVNSYYGFEEIVMNDWYCFKYAMCSGYRLQPRFMGSRVWIDMNFSFLEGIAGFSIRFFLFKLSYKIYENIFDFFNVCIDIKVYNNLYLAVNVVGIVRSIVLLSIDNDLLGEKVENNDKITD